MTTFAFDVYGTLIDPMAIAEGLVREVGDDARDLATIWREKQLEYSFRRALMGSYRPFPECTRQALDYACARTGRDLPATVRESLLERYTRLPAFDDAVGALETLRRQGHRLYAFSNGLPADLASLFEHAGMTRLLDGVVSVHDVATFKPDPAVYRHFTATAGTEPADTWLVSSNPFDVIGARAVGWQAAWIRRDPSLVFDPWEHEPTCVLGSLAELDTAIG